MSRAKAGRCAKPTRGAGAAGNSQPTEIIRFAAQEEQFAQGNSVLMERELDRAAQIKRSMPEAICVYVEPSEKVLEERLKAVSRSTLELSLRLQTAERLRAASSFCDRQVCSDDIEAAIREIESLLD